MSLNKRDILINKINELKENADEKTVSLYNEIIAELSNEKKYGLVWDKENTLEDVVQDCIDNIPVLKIDETKTILNGGQNNLLIEGDNYHSLLALNMIAKESVDVIYIDPPYNTGHEDFIYNDNFVNEDDGFRHSKWLSFMERRLKLARELLKDDGIIFISINDIEYGNLRVFCSEIFGENNVETIIWNKISEGGLAGSGKMKITLRFRIDHEYVIVCYKNKDLTVLNKPLRMPDWKTEYPNKDNDPRGPWCDGEISKSEAKSNPNGKNYYTITTPSGKHSYSRQWHFDKEEFDSYLNDTVLTENGIVVSRIWWGSDGEKCPRLKRFQNELKPTTPTSVIKGISQTDGNSDYDIVFDVEGDRDFNNPKPVKLIKNIVELSKNKNSVVLDFFAGSGTTGQAVLELNKEDGGNRKFILCTNNENNICEDVTYQRLKTVITGKRKDKSKYSDGLNGSLYYLKTDFVKNNGNSDQAKYNISDKLDALLCVKEDIFVNNKKTDYYSHYTNKENNNHLFIYNDYYNEDKFEKFINDVKKTDGHKIIYVFSIDKNIDDSVFEDLGDVEIKTMPCKSYEIYKEITEEIKRW